VDSWGPDQVRVRCFDASGTPVDTRFSVAFHRTPLDPFNSQYAFALADQPLEPEYVPPAATSWNASGGPVLLSRWSTGAYRAEWPGMADVGTDLGAVLVSAYDAQDGYCKVESWTSESAEVLCFDATGTLSDRAYSALYVKPDEGASGVAYVWANQPTASVYVPPSAYAHNPTGGAITLERSTEGQYLIHFDGYGATTPAEGHAQVTAYGSSSDYCIMNYSIGDEVSVECRDTSGARRDSMFVVLYLKPDAKRDGVAYGTFFGGTTSPSDYAYNPGGAPVTRALVAPGLYQVELPGFERHGLPGHQGHLQVSSFYAGDSNLCKGANLSASPSVACVHPDGTPVADDFALLVLRPTTAVPEPGCGASLLLGTLCLAGVARRRRDVSRPARTARCPPAAADGRAARGS
jgi:hypothetical protein